MSRFLLLSRSALPAMLLFWAIVGFWVWASFARDGAFTYALDDPYIHLALAKNLAFHGVWGTSPREFASASSSLAWTGILAFCLRLGGDNALWPLVLNVLCGSGVILALNWLLRREGASPLTAALVTTLLVFAAPLATLTVSGMEHALHILAVLLFLSCAADILASDAPLTRRQTLLFGALAAFLPAVRYEGLFAICAVALALLVRRRLALAFKTVLYALAPLAIFGLISVGQGALPFPNSVFLKVQTERTNSLYDTFATRILFWMVNIPEVALLLISLGLALIARGVARRRGALSRPWARTDWLIALFLGMFALHLQFARWGWLFRYEAYLMVCGGWILSVAAREFWLQSKQTTPAAPRTLKPFLLLPPAIGLVLLALVRGVNAWSATPPAMAHIHDQQIQMARFFGRYFRGQSVAANDIGAISYRSGVRLLDLYGIASRDVFEAKRAQRYDQNALTRIAARHDVQVAALYPNWFVPGGQSGIPRDAKSILPASWQRVGTWTLGKGGGFGAEVAFFAANPRASKLLVAALRDFAAQLPSTQKQSGLYTQFGPKLR